MKSCPFAGKKTGVQFGSSLILLVQHIFATICCWKFIHSPIDNIMENICHGIPLMYHLNAMEPKRNKKQAIRRLKRLATFSFKTEKENLV